MKQFLRVLGLGGLSLLLVFSPYGCSKELTYPRQVSLEEANKIVNAKLPVPAYLPDNLSIAAIYAMEHTEISERLAITFYPDRSGESGVTNIENAPIIMYVSLFRRGQVGGLKLVGDEYDIAGTRGVLVTTNASYALWWILPYRDFPGQYEMVLAADKDVPKEELVRIARSVPK